MVIDEREAPVFYEPWTPNIGQRVRVRLSGECQVMQHCSGCGYLQTHHPHEDTAIGTVQEVTDDPSGHRFKVAFEPFIYAPCGGCEAYDLDLVGYAAIELEPIDEASQ